MAKKHIVQCLYCKEKFDTNLEPYVKPRSNRYAHLRCEELHQKDLSQDDKDFHNLCEYIKNLFDEDFVNARTQKQIREYKQKYNYTYSGILKTLIYWYEVKGNTTEKANKGIGIVPYIYSDAERYYYNLYLLKMANSDKNIQAYKNETKEIEIYPPKSVLKTVKLLFEEEEA